MSKKFQVIVADPPWPFADRLKMSDVARGAEANYVTMSISDIKQLAVKDIAHPDGAVLALWVPSSLLQEGLDTMKSWGFEHKQTYIWVKVKKDALGEVRKIFFKFWKDLSKPTDGLSLKSVKKAFKSSADILTTITDGPKLLGRALGFGMGRLFRQTHEICLIGTSGKSIYKRLDNKSQRSVSFAENLKHSSKPEALQDSLEIMFPGTQRLEMFARRVRPGWICLGNEIDGKDIRDALSELK